MRPSIKPKKQKKTSIRCSGGYVSAKGQRRNVRKEGFRLFREISLELAELRIY